MKTEVISLWGNMLKTDGEIPILTAYLPDHQTHNSAIVILPGGAYRVRAEHEGRGYAEFLAQNGYVAFVCDYRVAPNHFPIPLFDARRAIQTVRYYASKYGIQSDKIAIMGSSAGGHLAALTATYLDPIETGCEDEIAAESFLPNAQILCYPVIRLYGKEITHFESGRNFLGEKLPEQCESLSPDHLVGEHTPQAFLWHTFDDIWVNVVNSLVYMKALKQYGVSAECHIYPHGQHGLGLAVGDSLDEKYVSKWSDALLRWLQYIDF